MSGAYAEFGIMAQGMRGDGFCDLSDRGGLAHGELDDALVQVMAAHILAGWVGVATGRGENPLPEPFAARVRVLAG